MTDITILNKRVKIQFVKPFKTIYKLIRLAKIGIEEMGYDEFTNYILSHKDECIQAIKKRVEIQSSSLFGCGGTRTHDQLIKSLLLYKICKNL